MSSSTSEENQKTNPNSLDENPLPKKGFFSSTMEELRLVVWPTRQQLFSESIAVILMVSISAAAIAAVSRFYGWTATQIFG